MFLKTEVVGEYENPVGNTLLFKYFLNNLFNCISQYAYREYIFVLSKRIKDVSFLLNSTFIDILDYMDTSNLEDKIGEQLESMLSELTIQRGA